MALTILKYPLQGSGEIVVDIAKNHKILCVKAQNDKPVLYALADTRQPLIKKKVQVMLTGFDLSFSLQEYPFLDTVLLFNGSLVYHIFCLKAE